MNLASEIYIDNDSVVVLKALKNRAGILQTDATVTLIGFTDHKGKAVGGVELPVTMNHVGDGDYEGIISKDIAVGAGRTYLATVRAVSAAGITGEWVETVAAKQRVA